MKHSYFITLLPVTKPEHFTPKVFMLFAKMFINKFLPQNKQIKSNRGPELHWFDLNMSVHIKMLLLYGFLF